MRKIINSTFQIAELLTTAGNSDRPDYGQAYQTIRLDLIQQPGYSIILEFMIMRGNITKPYFDERKSTLTVYFPLEMYDIVFKAILTEGARAQYALGSMFVISNEHVYRGDPDNVDISI
jgi:hypothetical protein